jgi:uncharacterized protein YbjQ (UPF0145 family)
MAPLTLDKIQTSTTFDIPGCAVVRSMGVVRGLIVRSPTIAQGILGGLKTMIGGNIEAYREVCEQARSDAFSAMLLHASQLGANAVIGVHYDTSEIGAQSRATEVLCYGTAVLVQVER